MRISSKKKGFSIVEELASISIIMLVVVVGLSSMLAYSKNVTRSGKKTINLADAQKKLGNSLINGYTDTTIKTSTDPTIVSSDPAKVRMTLNLGTATDSGGDWAISTVSPTNEIKSGTISTFTDSSTNLATKNKTVLKTYKP